MFTLELFFLGQEVLSALNVLTDMIDLMRWSRA